MRETGRQFVIFIVRLTSKTKLCNFTKQGQKLMSQNDHFLKKKYNHI